MDKRIFVEKKADFQVKSESLVRELQHNLGLSTLKSIRIVQVYDVFDLAEDLFAPAEKHIFSEQVTDHVLDEAAVQADLANYAFFAIESLPGQFDQRCRKDIRSRRSTCKNTRNSRTTLWGYAEEYRQPIVTHQKSQDDNDELR